MKILLQNGSHQVPEGTNREPEGTKNIPKSTKHVFMVVLGSYRNLRGR